MPPPTDAKPLSLALIFGFLVAIAGCSAIPATDLSNSDAIGTQVQHRYDAIDQYSAAVERTLSTPTGQFTRRADIFVKTGDWMVIQYRDGPAAGTVSRVDLSGTSAPQAIVKMTGRMAPNRQPPSLGSLTATLVATHNLSVQRTTMLDGHLTAVVHLEPRASNQSTQQSQYLWIDLDRQIPLKYESTWTTASGQTARETIRLSNVSIRANTTHSNYGEST